MKVIIYCFVFFAILAVVALGGALCENEKFTDKLCFVGRLFVCAVEKTVSALMMPIVIVSELFEGGR